LGKKKEDAQSASKDGAHLSVDVNLKRNKKKGKWEDEGAGLRCFHGKGGILEKGGAES